MTAGPHGASRPALALLDGVVGAQAELLARWMLVGFVHGVMNTDNMSILGLTTDYGPYGWLEGFEPGWTPNTTDAAGLSLSSFNAETATTTTQTTTPVTTSAPYVPPPYVPPPYVPPVDTTPVTEPAPAMLNDRKLPPTMPSTARPQAAPTGLPGDWRATSARPCNSTRCVPASQARS